jgi:hypothetical protein
MANAGATVATEANNKLIAVFPNPVQNTLNLNLSGFKGSSEVVVYNMNGKRMLSKQTANTNTTLDFSRLSKGIYMIRVFYPTGNSGNLKVIKN